MVIIACLNNENDSIVNDFLVVEKQKNSFYLDTFSTPTVYVVYVCVCVGIVFHKNNDNGEIPKVLFRVLR